MKLSIIVPIYNVEKYLRKCVDSLINQDLSSDEYEIILVDDGSTDNGGKIADEYSIAYSNISILHKHNEGVSEARNNGISLAKGEYIMFVDADDYLQPNVLNYLIKKMDSDKLDILRFNYRFVNDYGEEIFPNKYGKLFDDYRDEICSGETFLNERMSSAGYAWQFVLSRELTRIKFMSGIILGEDMNWTFHTLLEAKRVTSTNMVLYNYFVREGSATKTKDIDKIKFKMENQLWHVQQLKLVGDTLCNHSWFDGMIANTVLSILSNVALNFYDSREEYLTQLDQLRVFPISKRMLTPAAKRKRLLCNLSPRLYCWLMHITH